jgi:hypothetical protein
MSEYSRRDLELRLTTRIMQQSCESCLQREFDYYLEDTFVCKSCAYWGA